MNPLNTIATRRLSHRALAVAATTLLVVGATACADDTTATPTTPSTTETTSPTAPTSPPAAPTTTETATPTAAPIQPAAPTTTETETTDVSVDVLDASLVEVSVLTDDEVAGLLWMREEEQLAHDVYVVLGDLWGLRIFENIAASETTHIDAMTGLLDQYGIDDPAQGNELGTFTDPAMQALYDGLVADGSVSLDAALTVGALIEELDIADLQARSSATEIVEITTVYANLERGSRNHLRAFASQLDSRGVAYEPTQLDPTIFDAIVSSETERGRDA